MSLQTPRLFLAIAVTLTFAGCALAPLDGGSPSPSGVPTPSAPPTQSAQPSPSASPSPTPEPSGSAIPDPNLAIVRIADVGGFVPPQMTLNRYPVAVLYADGRLITQGAQPDIYPGAALPSLIETRLTAAGVAQVLEWARQAGLVGPAQTLGTPVPDVGETDFTIVYPDGQHMTTLYPIMGSQSPDPAIQALLDFESKFMDIHSSLPATDVGPDGPYQWDRLRVMSYPQALGASPDPSLVQVEDWPLASLATLGEPMTVGNDYRCAAISGSDLATLRPMLEQSNQLTLWRSDGQTYALMSHPLLPDDRACPSVQPY